MRYLAYIKETQGNILEEFAHLFLPPPQASNIGSDTQQIPIRPNVDQKA